MSKIFSLGKHMIFILTVAWMMVSPAVASLRAPERAVVQQAKAAVDISGKWQGSNSVTYVITQQGNKFTWTAEPTKGRASGTIEGSELRVSWFLGNLKGTATGRVTQRDSSGRPLRIEWSNGIVFTRPSALAPKILLPKIKIPLPKEEKPAEVQPRIPVPTQKLPEKLLIGEFVLTVEDYSQPGRWNPVDQTWEDVSGTGWLDFRCAAGLSIPAISRAGMLVTRTFTVVSSVLNPETEISLTEARLIRPGVRIGESVSIELSPESDNSESILKAKKFYLDILSRQALLVKGNALLGFANVTIAQVPSTPTIGRIITGAAVYPSPSGRIPESVLLAVDGFQVLVRELTLTPDSSSAHLVLKLPPSLGNLEDGGPALLDLGTTTISPDCQFYVSSDRNFGPWIIGDTGLVTEGKGYIADFSHSQSPTGKPPAWKGLYLADGRAFGDRFVPANSNTGYLTGHYRYSGATVIAKGFEGRLSLDGSVSFEPIHPHGYRVTAHFGDLILAESRIVSGELRNGTIQAPLTAVCDNTPGRSFQAEFTSLTIGEDLSLSGRINFPPRVSLCWGELTHPGEEMVVWKSNLTSSSIGYFYLPAGALPTFSPDTGTDFIRFNCLGTDETILQNIKELNMAGITIGRIEAVSLYSLDGRDGVLSPLYLPCMSQSWLNIASMGVNSNLVISIEAMNVKLGNKTREGYVGGQPFDVTLSTSRGQPFDVTLTRIQRNVSEFLFADSAVYDSKLNGTVRIPEPSGIPSLEFRNLEVTSTGSLVGGRIHLNPVGEDLAYWKLKLAPTSDTGEAGTLSVRTGRILFSAARLSEEFHFDHEFGINDMIPFKLTWGEMLADGNFGQLYLDPNVYGQRFDGLPFVAKNLVLSRYVPGATNGYFDVCGIVHFNFFGSAYVNIRDSRADGAPPEHHGRFVTVVNRGDAGIEPTNLHLHGEWNNRIAEFDFPNADMHYNEATQHGFTGKGTGRIDLVHSDPLNATIEIHSDAIDICLSSTATHDIRIPWYVHALCGIKDIYGCVRIEGPLLQRIVLGGYMENSLASGFGILSPKEASYVEMNIAMTPSSTIFYAAGDMLLYVAASSIDVSGQMRLAIDRARNSAEGEFMGRIDCKAVVGGLSGEGQLTWLSNPEIWYLQGRMKIAVCGWRGGIGLEGGFFVGNNVPKEKAWVLYAGSEHFGINERILPERLTGLYGYGQISFSTSLLVIFSGGIEIYAGMGAFSEIPMDVATPELGRGEIGLPYLLGTAGIHIHGEVLGGLVSAAAWASLSLRGPLPPYFSGTVGLKGCAFWVLCASFDLTAGISPTQGFFIEW